MDANSPIMSESNYAGQRPDENPSDVREQDRRYVWHPWSPISTDRSSLTISHGRDYLVWDIDGQEYIDGCSLNTTCGYGHPDVVNAVIQQLYTLHGVDISISSHEPVGRLAERLASYMPGTLLKTLFVNSGSEGIEAAMMIATSFWINFGETRNRVVAFARGYHGSTLLSRSLTALPRVGHPFQKPMPVDYVELPVRPGEIRHAEALPLLLNAFEQSIVSGSPPVAVVVEPFLNVGGGIVLPDGFLSGLRELCDRHNTLLIVDEIFTGYGRCGHMFMCQSENVEPDILVSSKGLGGGYVPIAATTVRQHIYDSFDKDPFIGGLRYGHTTSGHAVACAAALATLEVLEKENLIERARHFGKILVDRFASLAGRGNIVDIRGLGLILVIEMSSYEAARNVVSQAASKGLLLRQPGEAFMMVPPLTIDEAGIEEACRRLENVLGMS